MKLFFLIPPESIKQEKEEDKEQIIQSRHIFSLELLSSVLFLDVAITHFFDFLSSPRKVRKEALVLVNGSLTDMDQQSKSSPIPTPALHQSDANEDDENVKQLGECSSVYLALQVCEYVREGGRERERKGR